MGDVENRACFFPKWSQLKLPLVSLNVRVLNGNKSENLTSFYQVLRKYAEFSKCYLFHELQP